MIQTPYLLFLGDAPDQLAAKVAQGIKDWRPENAVGQFRMENCGATVGLHDMTLAEAKAAGVTCNKIQIESDQPYQAIIDAAKNNGCDMIVMASHGRKGIKRLLLGSETQQVLTHSHIPVLVLR